MEANKNTFWKRFKKQGAIQLFVWIGILYLVIFNVIPMFGILMAFKDYSISDGIKGIFTSEWVGLKYFIEFVTDYKFGRLVRNTVALSVLKLVFTFPVPIIFALLVNEIRNLKFKKILQTCSYLPHFISWVFRTYIRLPLCSTEGSSFCGAATGWQLSLFIPQLWIAYGRGVKGQISLSRQSSPTSPV